MAVLCLERCACVQSNWFYVALKKIVFFFIIKRTVNHCNLSRYMISPCIVIALNRGQQLLWRDRRTLVSSQYTLLIGGSFIVVKINYITRMKTISSLLLAAVFTLFVCFPLCLHFSRTFLFASVNNKAKHIFFLLKKNKENLPKHTHTCFSPLFITLVNLFFFGIFTRGNLILSSTLEELILILTYM